jgi:LPS O-antigen subunit length determinant protein (WzzB/FepE family)
MEQDVAEAEQSIAYLDEQIENTSLAEMRSVFFRLIEDQTRTIVLAKISNEYLFKTIDPAIVPEKKDSPKRSLMVIFATLFGGLLGMIAHVLRSMDLLVKRSSVSK